MTRPPAADSGEDGFGLVETIVALAILAMVVATAIEIVGTGAIRERISRGRMTALLTAQSELARLTVNETPLADATEKLDDGSTLRIEAAPTSDAPAQQAVIPYRVMVEVTPPSGRGAVRLESIVLGRARASGR